MFSSQNVASANKKWINKWLILLIIFFLVIGIVLGYELAMLLHPSTTTVMLKLQDAVAKKQQEAVEGYPLNSSRGFTLQIGNELTYFEFISLEILKDLDSMLFMPNEIPDDAVIAFENHPFIASVKFSFRVKCSGDPSSLTIGEINIEKYYEEERAWKSFMWFELPRSAIEMRDFCTHSLRIPPSCSLNHVILQEGDKFDIYWGVFHPPLKEPLWFNGIDKNIRLHAILHVISYDPVRYQSGDVLYQAGNMVVVYERGFELTKKNYYVDHLHVYIEPFEIPFVKFKIEGVRFLSGSELGQKFEIILRNVGNLPIIGKAHELPYLAPKGYADFVADFEFFPEDSNILTVNEEGFNTFYGGRLFYFRDPHVTINLPKPWEEEGWAVIIFPNETIKTIVYTEVKRNWVVISGQEGLITLHAKPIIQRVLGIEAYRFEYRLDLRKITIEVENDGDTPLFAEKSRCERIDKRERDPG
jgi:hypothetical protein